MRRKTAAEVAGALLLTTAMWAVGGTQALAGNGFEIRLSHFSPGDDSTETTFSLDSGPVPQIGYRWQRGAHNVFAGAAFARWEATNAFGGRTELTWLPVDAHYRYGFWHDRSVSLYVGGGLTWNFYDAFVDSPGGPVLFVDETGYALGIGPVVGVEFLAPRSVRLVLDAHYSEQLFDSGDLDDLGSFALEVDMGGLRATFGVAFVFGD